MDALVVREIQPGDNPKIARLIRNILEGMGVPKTGTAYEDSALDDMYSTYKEPRSSYFIAEKNGRILGCVGIAPLPNYKDNTCELQKMYVAEEARGQGIAQKLMETCLSKAKANGFDTCYLETLPFMKAAQGLYQKSGFHFTEERLGDTGHYSCTVFMIKKL